jgi:glycosyltransferase involved in cell wall biosynthesis
MTISVIIPVLNEQEALPSAIAALGSCCGVAEIVVADGGSTDGTLEWMRSNPLGRNAESAGPQLALVNSVRGKGPQINAGAAAAAGDVLLFLHADSAISQPALDALTVALADLPRRVRDHCGWWRRESTCAPACAAPPPATRESLCGKKFLKPWAALLTGRCLKT